jgi:tetratricopeptide (TPR) repeat protein/transcriptional regulator with XRE-family HTH domain
VGSDRGNGAGGAAALQRRFGSLLRDSRRAASFTQEDLAARTGLSVRALSDLERGRTTRPYRRSVQLICDALGLSGQARADFFRAARCGPDEHPETRPITAALLEDPASHQQYRALAAPAPPLVPRQLPAGQPHFAGRAAEMERLTALLAQHDRGQAMTIAAIGGTAGVGKTALALHWAHQVADRFPDGQLYINLRGFDPSASPMAGESALRTFLDALQAAQSQIPASLEAQIGLYRSLLAGRRCLIVLDNAFDTAQMRMLLPGSPGCFVIVTSRSELTSLVAADGAQLITLDIFSDNEAQEMVTQRLGHERVAAEPTAVREMIGLCARLPLAVSIAVARAAARPGFPLGVVVSELRDASSRLDALEVGEAAASVRAVFSWSYQNLSDAAARVFRLLSEHPGPDISAAATASLAGVPRAQARTALRELARFHLVTEHVPGRFTFHDLLRTFAGEQARAQDGDDQRCRAVQRLLDHYLQTCCLTARVLDSSRDPIPLDPPLRGVQPEDPGSYHEAWTWLEAEYRVLLAISHLAPASRIGEHAWQIPWTMQTFFYRRGHWQDFAAVQRNAVDVAVRLADWEGQAYANHGLGRACALIGSYTEADKYLSLAVQLYRQLGERTAEARCHIDVGHVLARQALYPAALIQAREAEELYRAAGHEAGQAGALNNIGWYQIQMGEYQSARVYCQQALSRFQAAGSRHGAAIALASLGCAYNALGDHNRGIESCEEALRCIVEHGDLPNQADILTQLGDIHREIGNHAVARDCWQQASVILTGLNHPDATSLRGRLNEGRVAS